MSGKTLLRTAIFALVAGLALIAPVRAEEAPALVEVASVDDWENVQSKNTLVPIFVEFVNDDNTLLEQKLRIAQAELNGRATIVKVNVKRASEQVLSIIGECSIGDKAKSDEASGVPACHDEYDMLPVRMIYDRGRAVQEMSFGGEGTDAERT